MSSAGPRLSRRALLVGGATVALVGVGVAPAAAAERDEALAAIGAAYLDLRPREASVDWLQMRIWKDGYTWTSKATIGDPERWERFAGGIEQQRLAGRTVIVDGWLLADLAGRLCAFHHLWTAPG